MAHNPNRCQYFGSQDASVAEGFPYDCHVCKRKVGCQLATLQSIRYALLAEYGGEAND